MSDYLVLDGITKRFGSLTANDHISLTVQKQHVHALLGENGAGKSTLMKILYGVYKPDSGTITLDGKELNIHSPQASRAAGIGMVFQSFMLIPAFTVTENIALSLRDVGIVVDEKKIEQEITRISDKYRFDIDPKAKVWQLPLGAQQKVEIIKLVMGGAKLLIFDEPTSVLAPHEVQGLFDIFNNLRNDGYTIIFISHKLNEVLAATDAVTVLRQGKVVGSVNRADATEEVLVSLIIGEKTADARSYERKPITAQTTPVLKIRDLKAKDDRDRLALNDISLEIKPGEILGVAGVSGNGQRELGEVIQGVRPALSGSIILDGIEILHASIEKIRQTGVTCVPEDPLKHGAVPPMSVEGNLALSDVSNSAERDWKAMNWSAARERASWFTEKFGLKMPRLNVAIEALSGGNIQRIVFARELSSPAKLLLAYYPTRGLDIHAAEIVRLALLDYRDQGAAVLLISEDLDELFAISDRIMVMFHGHNVGELAPDPNERQKIGYLMTDGKYTENPESSESEVAHVV
ncbi:MAG: ATP-binding cassette domain-containing protein [Chloroflexi bacterium]|nr:ATP-binding cassette domain-containing protein [Chloroflexota bacterium]